MLVMVVPLVISMNKVSLASTSEATIGVPTVALPTVFSLTPMEVLASTGGSLTSPTATTTDVEAHRTGLPLSHTLRLNLRSASGSQGQASKQTH
jgi:hypothetical protein